MPIKYENAQDIAVAGLGFIAGNIEELRRFLSLTGVDPEDIRNQAGNVEFMAAVLDYLLENESVLLAFSVDAKIDPANIKQARFSLLPVSESEEF